MRKIKLFYLLFLLFPLVFVSCYSGDDCCDEDEEYYVVDTTKPVIAKETLLVVYKYKLNVQIGAFANKNYADDFAKVAREKLKYSVEIRLYPDGLYKLLVGGEFVDINKAIEILEYVRTKGYFDAFIRDDNGPIDPDDPKYKPGYKP